MVTAEFKEYLVRDDGHGVYTVSKWEGGKEPTQVYTVKLMRGKWQCNCPAGHNRGTCPHPGIVQKWVRGGKKPMMIAAFTKDMLIEVLSELGVSVNNGKVRVKR